MNKNEKNDIVVEIRENDENQTLVARKFIRANMDTFVSSIRQDDVGEKANVYVDIRRERNGAVHTLGFNESLVDVISFVHALTEDPDEDYDDTDMPANDERREKGYYTLYECKNCGSDRVFDAGDGKHGVCSRCGFITEDTLKEWEYFFSWKECYELDEIDEFNARFKTYGVE